MKLMRPARQTGPLPPPGRNLTRPKSLRPAVSASNSSMQRSPQSYATASKPVLLPDIPNGVVLDGKVTHLASPKPTVQKKYLNSEVST